MYCLACGEGERALHFPKFVNTLSSATGPSRHCLLRAEGVRCLQAADHLLYTREAISGIAHAHGLVACFLPKPFQGQAGSACHCHLSLWKASAPKLSRLVCLHSCCLLQTHLCSACGGQISDAGLHEGELCGCWLHKCHFSIQDRPNTFSIMVRVPLKLLSS